MEEQELVEDNLDNIEVVDVTGGFSRYYKYFEWMIFQFTNTQIACFIQKKFKKFFARVINGGGL